MKLLIWKMHLFTPWILMSVGDFSCMVFQPWRVWRCKCWTTWLRLLLFLQSCREFYRWVSEGKNITNKLLPSCAIQLWGRAEHIPDVVAVSVRLSDGLIQSIPVNIQLVRVINLVVWPGGLGSVRRCGNTQTCVKTTEVISANQKKYYLEGCNYFETETGSSEGCSSHC